MSDFLDRLREYDQALGRTPMRSRASARTREAFAAAQPRRTRVLPWVGAALIPALTGIAVWLTYGREQTRPQPQSHAPSAQVPGSGCVVQTRPNQAREYRGACEVQLPSMHVSASAGAELEEAGGLVTVLFGDAHFAVNHVSAGAAPVRVAVAGGEIRVLGTEFHVSQSEGGGQVALHSGSIRFLPRLGEPQLLSPGQRLSWKEAWRKTNLPDPTAPESTPPDLGAEDSAAVESDPSERRVPEVSPRVSASPAKDGRRAPRGVKLPEAASVSSSPATGTTSSTSKDIQQPPAAASLEQVIQLRARGEYRQALTLLDQVYAESPNAHSREVLSYERGTLLERLGAANACAQWRSHAAQFPNGRYAASVEQRLLQCQRE
jgi:FecR protein